MPYLIDAHEDLAWNWLCFKTDYSRSVKETRLREAGEIDKQREGGTLFGWPEYSRGQVALVFGTYFIAPKKYAGGAWDQEVFSNSREYNSLIHQSADYYQMLTDQHPEMFRRILNKADLTSILQPWKQPVDVKNNASTPPMGIINLIEGSEGLGSLDELEEWWRLGARLLGPVWAGTRFCGGTHEGREFTGEGRQLMHALAEIGYILDVAHMNDLSVAAALEEYEGTVIASHANCRWLLNNPSNQRHLSQENIRRMVERGGVIGVMPYARFLRTDWDALDPAHHVTLEDLANHVDAICQLAGNCDHVAIGTDFDGGFGWPCVPEEINSIEDMQKLAPVLQKRGYTTEQVAAIFHGNWERILYQALPEL
jgi:membrane dipeptidase